MGSASWLSSTLTTMNTSPSPYRHQFFFSPFASERPFETLAFQCLPLSLSTLSMYVCVGLYNIFGRSEPCHDDPWGVMKSLSRVSQNNSLVLLVELVKVYLGDFICMTLRELKMAPPLKTYSYSERGSYFSLGKYFFCCNLDYVDSIAFLYIYGGFFSVV